MTIEGQHGLDLLCINCLRFLAVDAVEKAKSGHPGLPLGAAPMAYVLWDRFLKFNPLDPDWPNRDRFVLSAGHGCALLYALLHVTGYDLSLDELKKYRQWNSLTPGHPEYKKTPGVEATTGPLGQGFSNAVGMAMAEQILAARFNRPDYSIVDHYTYVIASDGDMMEGVTSEAASLAGHQRLGKLIVFYDQNRITIEGHTTLAFTEDVGSRFFAYGWHVQHIEDGNDLAGIYHALETAKQNSDRPSLILVNTHIGFGSPHKQDTAKAHGEPLGKEEVELTKRHLGWPIEPLFFLPEEVLKHFRESLIKGKKYQDDWNELFSSYSRAFPELAAEFERVHKAQLPTKWSAGEIKNDEKEMSSRDASELALNHLAHDIPELIGGAADLAPSTKSHIKEGGDFEAANRAGRNMHFGIREHAMGGVLNGMAVHKGLIVYGATFLIFSDYMRPPIRLAAMTGLPVIYIFTHDSIGLGEDGPTHQPVEQLLGLRSVPGLTVIRPADANETLASWEYIIAHRCAPMALILTRQKLPILDIAQYPKLKNGVSHGGYILADTKLNSRPDLIIIATGSEVHLALGTKKRLEANNIAVRVVNVPSVNILMDRPDEYIEEIIPAFVPKLIIEAGRSLGWVPYLYNKKNSNNIEVVGVDRYGASAPGEVVMDEYGVNVEKITIKALEFLQKAKSVLRNGDNKMETNHLVKLHQFGQSIWSDYIDREMIYSGKLQSLMEKDEVTGVTSNPSIFEKAISGSDDYDPEIRTSARLGKTAQEIYEDLTVSDIKKCADILLPVFKKSKGEDGFVSLEVSPHLAYDTEGSIVEARRLWQKVAKVNLLVKIPATPQGVIAIRKLISEGINVNVTLLFDLDRYSEVVEAYLSGLEDRIKKGESINGIVSVASFFLSRIDIKVDKLLLKMMKEDKVKAPMAIVPYGEVAISSAKIAYQKFKEIFSSERFNKLKTEGAKTQKLLWASTGTKNATDSDTKYVEALIGPATINTLPIETINAYRDHGSPDARLETGVKEAFENLEVLKKLEIDLKKINRELEIEGVKKFSESYDKLMSILEEKRSVILVSSLVNQTQKIFNCEEAVSKRTEMLIAKKFSENIWNKNPLLWKTDAASEEMIKNSLGWLDIVKKMKSSLKDEIVPFVDEVKKAGFQNVVHMGMGGSSLAPLVFSKIFSSGNGLPVIVLDSTDPETIKKTEKSILVENTLFIIASKSGETAEPLAFNDYFYDLVKKKKGERAKENFIVITDPGTSLEMMAQKCGYRHIFRNASDIGGRYSALSYFGLIPAALMGIDLDRLLNSAEAAVNASHNANSAALVLGAYLGEMAKEKRDKLTIFADQPIASFALWLEQLVAESTGKENTGIIPIALEPIGDPSSYGTDRCFVYLHLKSTIDSHLKTAVENLVKAGFPVAIIEMSDAFDLGQEFFNWEFATAVAGSILEINPFDQPNVQESKDNTDRLLSDVSSHSLNIKPNFAEGNLSVYTDLPATSIDDVFLRFLNLANPGDYVALMAFIPANSRTYESLQRIRVKLRNELHLATTSGYGPRFLHSTGQLHKGGPDSGLFLQMTSDSNIDVPIPERRYSFARFKEAQAQGDLESLKKHGRRVMRIHLGGDLQRSLDELESLVNTVLQDRLSEASGRENETSY